MNNLANYIINNFDRFNYYNNVSSNCLFIDDFIDFFYKETITDKRITNHQKNIFSDSKVHQIIDLKTSLKLRNIFSYLIKIIESFPEQSIHIHINIDLTEAEIESLKMSFSWYVFKLGFKDSILIKNELVKLNLETEILHLPLCRGAILNRLERNNNGRKHRLRLLRFLMGSINELSNEGFLLNINRSGENEINLSDFSTMPQSSKSSINFGKSIQEIFDTFIDIETNANPLLEFTTVINLFPILYGSNVWYNSYQKENLNNWNEIENCNFTKIITITAKEETFENLLKLKKENKFMVDEMYTIFPFELI